MLSHTVPEKLLEQFGCPDSRKKSLWVIADEGCVTSLRLALLRSIVGYLALCFGFIAPFVGRDKKAGKFWLDKLFHTRAILLN